MKAAPTCRILLAPLLAIASVLPAAEPAEVTQLKAQYQTAVSKAVQELTEIYKSQLQELQKKYRAANDSGGIAATTNELVRISAPSSILPPGPGTKPTAEEASPLGAERFFAGKSWFTPSNSEFRFSRDGSGDRVDIKGFKTPFTWRKMDTGILEVIGSLTPGGPMTKWFFKFDNNRTALMGNNLDKLDWPCRPDK